MSAYSDWKYGLITDAEYNAICRREWYEDQTHWSKGHDWDDDELDDEKGEEECIHLSE